MINAEIIIVGKEILQGRVLDTNSNWLSKELLKIGIKVRRIYVIDDDGEEIKETLMYILKRKPNIIIFTGGLGPTFDDITVESVAKALNLELIEDKRALEIVLEACKRGNLKLTKERRKMALIPKDSLALKNEIGTAPGVYINYAKSHIFLLPGVPSEMKNIFEKEVKAFLIKMQGRNFYSESFIEVEGITESELAKIIREYKNKYQKVYIKSHPKGLGEEAKKILIHLSIFTEKKEEIKLINTVKENLTKDLKNRGLSIR